MAQTSWPFDGIDTTETQFSQWARNFGEGVKGTTATTDLKAYGDSTGMQVKVPAGQAMVRGHYYANDALVTLAIATANATLPRIDSVVLTLDPTLNTIVLGVVTGTAAASPVAPTLTQTDSAVYQLLLANVAVGAAVATITAGNVTDARTFLGNVTLNATQTLTNKTLTAPAIASILNGGTLTLPSGTDTLVGRTTADTLTNKTLQSPREITTVSATAATGTIAYDVATQGDLYYTTNATANFTLNFRGNSTTTLNTLLAVGQSVTVVFRNTNGATAFFANAFQIDGTAVTPKWQGGTAPASGNANATDVYSFVITKTAATPTYTVFASVGKFA